MFGEVQCNHDLFGEHKGETHQTKDLGSFLDHYEITPAGRLEFLEYRIEDRSDPNAKGVLRLVGSLTRIFTGKRRDVNFEGWLHFSVFGRAEFVDGTIVAFEPEPYDLNDEETTDYSNPAARSLLRRSIRGLLENDSRSGQPREHMTVRDFSEELKLLDQDSEVSVVIPDLLNPDFCSVIIVDEHGKGIELKLTVEAVKPANLVQSKSGVINSGTNIRGRGERKDHGDPNNSENHEGEEPRSKAKTEGDRRGGDGER